jgi:hypothetical protein
MGTVFGASIRPAKKWIHEVRSSAVEPKAVPEFARLFIRFSDLSQATHMSMQKQLFENASLPCFHVVNFC